MANPVYPDITIDTYPKKIDADLQFTAEITQVFNINEVATFELTITNTGESECHLEFGPTPPFSDYWGQLRSGDNGTLIIVSEEQHSKVIPDKSSENGCWRPTGPVIKHKVKRHIQLRPGSSLTGRYVILAHQNNTPCFPPGKYLFRSNEPIGKSFNLSVSIELEY